MAEESTAASRAELHMQRLRHLHTSFVPSTLTKKQAKDKKDRARGHNAWVKILEAHREDRASENESDDEVDDRTHLPPFRFLDLTPELRNEGYKHYLEDARDWNNRNDMRRARARRRSSPWI